ncbi:hemolysin [Candidatus Woesearchaeota archaeon B3_Woes]|nr:MAG: hemolysin [Candidatus Woesearchaeota archaeon B3_Woes]
MLIEFVTLFILLILSGFFSGLETAYISLTHIQIKKLKDIHKRNATLVEQLKDNGHKLITTILICNNLVNIGAASLATYLTMMFFGSGAIGITTGILTLFILVFGEVTPKKLAIDHSEFICLHAAGILSSLMIIFTPIIWIIDRLSCLIILIFGRREEKPKMTEEDIINAVEIGEEIGELEPQEKKMINNIFKFNDIEVKDIMTHRTEMFSLDEETKLSDMMDKIKEGFYSRIPIYSKTKDNIKGILLLKQIIPYLNKNTNIKIKKIMMKPLFVPETKKIDHMLEDFKKKKTHIAVVVDSKGGVSGIVTIEDVIEEIVGDIYDEKDIVHKKINRLNKNTYLVHGDSEIKLVNKLLRLRLSQKDEVLSEYILRRIGKIPEQGQEIKLTNGKFVVDKVLNNRIELVKYIKK